MFDGVFVATNDSTRDEHPHTHSVGGKALETHEEQPSDSQGDAVAVPTSRESTQASDGIDNGTEHRRLIETESSDQEIKAGTLSVWEATVAIANILIGSSILTLPYAFRKCGWVALAVLLGVCGVMTFTGLAVGQTLSAAEPRFAADATPVGSRDFAALGTMAWGTRGGAFVAVVFMLELVAIAMTYFLLIGVNMGILTGMPASWSIIASGVVTFFLSNLRIKFLASLSLISVAAIIGSAAALILSGVVNFVNDDVLDDFNSFHENVRVHGLLVAFGLSAFCFAGHACLPSIYWSMRDTSQYGKACVGGFAISCAFFLAVGGVGYFLFGSHMHQVFTANIAVDLDGEVVSQITWVRAVAVALVTVKFLGTLPLLLLPVFASLESYALPLSEESNDGERYALRIGVLVVTVVIVLGFQDAVSKVVEATGCGLTMMTSLVFPCAFLCTIATVSTRVRLAAIVLCILGVLFGLMGTLDALGASP